MSILNLISPLPQHSKNESMNFIPLVYAHRVWYDVTVSVPMVFNISFLLWIIPFSFVGLFLHPDSSSSAGTRSGSVSPPLPPAQNEASSCVGCPLHPACLCAACMEMGGREGGREGNMKWTGSKITVVEIYSQWFLPVWTTSARQFLGREQPNCVSSYIYIQPKIQSPTIIKPHGNSISNHMATAHDQTTWQQHLNIISNHIATVSRALSQTTWPSHLTIPG